MSATVCYLDSDASAARLISGESDRTWQADPPEEGEDRAHPAEQARRNVAEAAAWAADQIGARKRIDLVCIGVDESLCTWLTAPSTDMQVVTAAIRRRQQDWGDSFSASLIQPLARAENADKPKSTIGAILEKRRQAGDRKDAAGRKSAHLAVLQLQDGPARLWLDHLDSRGVRIGAVTTLWHVMARAWGRDPAPTGNGSAAHPVEEAGQVDLTGEQVVASVLLEAEGRLTWAWSVAGRLVAAGRVSVPRTDRPMRLPDVGGDKRHPEVAPMRAACARLTLDWLTWSAQLGRRPDEIVLIGRHANEASPEIERAWHGAVLRAIEEDDPVAATLQAITADPVHLKIEGEDPRQAVVDLTNRPSRSLRRLFLWSAAAILLLAVGVAGFGMQFRGWIADLRSEARQRTDSIQDALAELGVSAPPGLEVRTMESELAALRDQTAEFEEPQPPLPILDELMRLGEQLAAVRDEEGAQVDRIVITDASASATVRMSEFAPLEQLRASLTGDDGMIRWRGQIDGSPPNVSLRLSGTWEATP